LEGRIEYFERMLADKPDNPTGLLALANEYNEVERHEDEAAVLERYAASHKDRRTVRQHPL
jgi:predicted Zn-dependent protease